MDPTETEEGLRVKIERLGKKLARYEKAIEIYEKCREFYADDSNWDFSSDRGGYKEDTTWTEICDGAGCFTSGKTAREAKKKVDEILKDA